MLIVVIAGICTIAAAIEYCFGGAHDRLNEYLDSRMLEEVSQRIQDEGSQILYEDPVARREHESAQRRQFRSERIRQIAGAAICLPFLGIFLLAVRLGRSLQLRPGAQPHWVTEWSEIFETALFLVTGLILIAFGIYLFALVLPFFKVLALIFGPALIILSFSALHEHRHHRARLLEHGHHRRLLADYFILLCLLAGLIGSLIVILGLL